MKKLATALLLLTALGVSSAQALTIRFYTKVTGYNGGNWIEIVDGAPKAKPANVNGKWITDRVERGAALKIAFEDYTPTKPYKCQEVLGVARSNGQIIGIDVFNIPAEFVGTCTKDVKMDNVVLKVYSLKDSDQKTRRIPIGGR